jgi:hypothetical protein
LYSNDGAAAWVRFAGAVDGVAGALAGRTFLSDLVSFLGVVFFAALRAPVLFLAATAGFTPATFFFAGVAGFLLGAFFFGGAAALALAACCFFAGFTVAAFFFVVAPDFMLAAFFFAATAVRVDPVFAVFGAGFTAVFFLTLLVGFLGILAMIGQTPLQGSDMGRLECRVTDSADPP